MVAALAAVYLVWGSTYLGIAIALEGLPPFLLGAFRFGLAALIMVPLVLRWTGLRPDRQLWRAALVTGALMPFAGNGAVILAERRAPSGLVALIIATVPLWMVLLDWLRPGGRRPGLLEAFGLLGGLVGIALLVDPGATLGNAGVPLFETAILMAGGIAWAAGSLHSRNAAPGSAVPMLAALQMVVAAGLFFTVAVARGELSGFSPAAVGLRSWLAIGYLAAIGSVIAYSAYVWLMRATTPSLAASYAYVNPVVALALGALFAGEVITGRVVLASVILLGAVVVLSVAARQRVRPVISPALAAPVPGGPPDDPRRVA